MLEAPRYVPPQARSPPKHRFMCQDACVRARERCQTYQCSLLVELIYLCNKLPVRCVPWLPSEKRTRLPANINYRIIVRNENPERLDSDEQPPTTIVCAGTIPFHDNKSRAFYASFFFFFSKNTLRLIARRFMMAYLLLDS